MTNLVSDGVRHGQSGLPIAAMAKLDIEQDIEQDIGLEQRIEYAVLERSGGISIIPR